ncbi:MAG: hypothetical protein KAS12_02360, partial [Candidatus Aenigmarchaeota archaeon]|nr:hypothetical protein [Candidatus Aenigmarchaeota archaeon]
FYGVFIKKGQSATEYLMTYGWAILVIVIVGGLLYAQVFSNKGCATGVNGFDMAYTITPVGNQYYIEGTTGLILIAVENRMDTAVTITAINDIALNGGDRIIKKSVKSTINATIPALVGAQGECYSKEIRISYNTGFVSNIQSTGTINGRYS